MRFSKHTSSRIEKPQGQAPSFGPPSGVEDRNRRPYTVGFPLLWIERLALAGFSARERCYAPEINCQMSEIHNSLHEAKDTGGRLRGLAVKLKDHAGGFFSRSI